MNEMKISDAAGFIASDCGNEDFGPCDVSKALEHFDGIPWERELAEFEKLDGKHPTPCWPALTFRIGKYHIGFMLESNSLNFQVEVCTPPVKKTLGIFKITKFFEFRNVEPQRAREYLKNFYALGYSEQFQFYENEKNIHS